VVVVEVVVFDIPVAPPDPPVSYIEIVISVFEISNICSLNGEISFDSKETVTSTFAVPSAITIGLNDDSATFPLA
jgi:hypothetical protein